MQRYLITNFGKWKSINEAEFPGRTKQTAGMGQRVVGVPLDETSFKIKAIRDLDVLDANGKLTPAGFNSILAWIKQQPKWLPYYPALNDLAKNILVYSVDKDTESRQVITFAIQPKPQGVPAETQFINKNDVATLGADKATLLGNAIKRAEGKQEPKSEVKTGGAAVKLQSPLSFEQVKLVKSGQPVFDLIDSAYLNMVKMQDFVNLPIMSKLKAELKAGQLGDATVTFIKGIIAGFKLLDKYGDPVEAMNQQVADKLALFAGKATAQNASRSYFLGLDAKSIFEQTLLGNDPAQGAEGVTSGGSSARSFPADFDTAAFVAAVGGTGAPALGDIKLPEGGFKKGEVAKGDAEFKKFQKLVIDTFAKKLANHEFYKKFAKFGADGNYGPTTETMVAALKSALGASEKDGKVVTQELITKINTNTIDESVYLGLDARLVEQFDMGAFEETVKTYSAAKPKEKGKGEKADSNWLDSIKSRLEKRGNVYVKTSKEGEKFLKFKGAQSSGAYAEIYNNKVARFYGSDEQVMYEGVLSQDGTVATLENGKTRRILPKVDEEVWSTESVALVFDSNFKLLYRHEDKTKPIGTKIGERKGEIGGSINRTYYEVILLNPDTADKKYKIGLVLTDNAEIKTSK